MGFPAGAHKKVENDAEIIVRPSNAPGAIVADHPPPRRYQAL